MSRARNWWWFIDRIDDFESHMHAIRRTVHHEQTEFQEVGIVESVAYGKILVLDGDMQSSQFDEFIYHESMVHPPMISHPNPKKVLILGGGEGATLREVLRHKTVERAVMIDIDKRLVEICREFLPEYSQGAFDDPRAEVVFTDALAWMEGCKEKFDVIIGDLTDPLPQTPSHGLHSIPFFKLVRDSLAEGGIYVTQSSRISFTDSYLYNLTFSNMSKVFPVLRTACSYIPGFDIPWSFTSASMSLDPAAVAPDEVDRRVAERIGDSLRHYDGQTHVGLYALPKFVRRARAEFLENPVEMGEKEPFYII